MKAVILAAGEGRRLKPITNLRPKPMIPIANRPLLEHVVTAVVNAGINDIVLVVGYKRERIQTYFGDGKAWNVNIEYAVQEKQLGTGHAIAQAKPFIDGDFLVLNGDRIIESKLVERLVRKHKEARGTSMAVTRSDAPSEYGVTELDGETVTGITEKPLKHETSSDFINAGVYGFEASIFDAIQAADSTMHGENRITEAIGRLVKNDTVRAVRSQGMWIDVSNLWDILSVNSNVLDQIGSTSGEGEVNDAAHIGSSVLLGTDCRVGPNATLLHGTSIGQNVSIAANVVISNSVVFPDVSIGEGAVLKDCVVGNNVVIGPNATVVGGEGDVVIEGDFYEGVTLGGVLGDNSSIGGGTLVESGSVLGNNTNVASGAVVEGRIPSHAEVRRG